MSSIKRYLPNNEYDAAINANAPTAANPFATIADVGANDEWSEVLSNGNTTSGQNPQVTDGDQLQFGGTADYLHRVGTELTYVSGRGHHWYAVNSDMLLDNNGSLRVSHVANDNDLTISSSDGNIFWNDGTNTGSFQFDVMSAPRTWTLPDASGTIALLSDVQASDTLTEILTNGNTTANGQSIQALNGNGFLSLRNDNTDGVVVLSNDNGDYTGDGFYAATGYTAMYTNGWGPAVEVRSLAGGDRFQAYIGATSVGMSITDDTAHTLVNSGFLIGQTDVQRTTSNPIAGDWSAVLLSELSTLSVGVDRTVIIGGQNITAKTDDTVYVPSLAFNNNGVNLFESRVTFTQPTADRSIVLPDASGTVIMNGVATSGDILLGNGFDLTYTSGVYTNNIRTTLLTGNRTIDFQDASGTLAFLSDVNALDLQDVLGVDNASGLYDILMSDGRYVKFSDGGSFTVNVKGPATVSTSSKNVLFKDEAGTVALVSDITGLGTGITQTYSTTSTTHAARNYSALTNSTGGTIDGTLSAISGSGDDTNINNNFADIYTQLSNLALDQANTAQVLNQLIDNAQGA